MNSLQGQLLIAVPHLPDENFFRSVVLIIQHDDEGARGLVLNRPSNISLQEIWAQIATGTLSRNGDLNIGGPVEGPLMALHDQVELSELEVIPSVYLSMQREHLDQLAGDDDGQVRFFTGYSGWGPGQLEHELKVGGWLTTTASPHHVYEDPAALWQTICEEVGHGILFDRFNPQHIPDDPSNN